MVSVRSVLVTLWLLAPVQPHSPCSKQQVHSTSLLFRRHSPVFIWNVLEHVSHLCNLSYLTFCGKELNTQYQVVQSCVSCYWWNSELTFLTNVLFKI